ncbi:hypothetical protein UCYN_10260 [Candidatus Atelocyanobacterium thalassa isolate ALOHA]|uniref:Uncharacterized protein n=1 Tax=Atelocyanobacterium thalassa (isolate ALOHA) TaxID=1453429 RepID=D3EQF1_ATETH|nr:hypothetical protein UCYN_10260 [Candidatus Atelocyanobacterium thalassa isolate ALOHA]
MSPVSQGGSLIYPKIKTILQVLTATSYISLN